MSTPAGAAGGMVQGMAAVQACLQLLSPALLPSPACCLRPYLYMSAAMVQRPPASTSGAAYTAVRPEAAPARSTAASLAISPVPPLLSALLPSGLVQAAASICATPRSATEALKSSDSSTLLMREDRKEGGRGKQEGA